MNEVNLLEFIWLGMTDGYMCHCERVRMHSYNCVCAVCIKQVVRLYHIEQVVCACGAAKLLLTYY